MSRTPDVAIVGGGVIGGAIALELARRGLAVTLLESGRIGRGASRAAAGVLAPDYGAHDNPRLAALAADSLALWPDWAEALERESGVGLNYRRDGLLHVWVDPSAPGLPPDLATEPPPPEVGERIGPAEVRKLEPSLTGPIAGGVLARSDAHVDNPRLAPALARAAGDRGVRVRTGTPVVELLIESNRCLGVRAAGGERIEAGAVVIAAGVWSGAVAASTGIAMPMEPWRGQMLAFEADARPLRRSVFCGELVLVPRPYGPLVVGTTLERAGFDPRVTLGGLAQILARAERVAPGLANLTLAKSWAGLRPGTPDGLPYLGPVPGLAGLHVATGHGRKGIILAPITARLMTRLIADGQVDDGLRPFLPARVLHR